MINSLLDCLLEKYSISSEFAKKIREDYRKDLEKILLNGYEKHPLFRYGGSLSKGTANINSCDIDLLCYLPAEEQMSVENIYLNAQKSLSENGYYIEPKNSAICVKGNVFDKNWEMTVDVVPGKYTSNFNNKDVFLWCNKNKCRLKSNPELQINKIKQSCSKDVIRLIKLYRSFNNFKFKSFFLENFCIDVVEPTFDENDSLYDKLVKFCEHWNEIGKNKIFDPANSDNNIMDIHSEDEFEFIRQKIYNLYDALMTNDKDTITNCILNKAYSLDDAYLNDAKRHSNLKVNSFSACSYGLTLKGFKKENNYPQFDNNTIISKGTNLRFEITIPNSIQVKAVKLIVSNSGYEAAKNSCLRGNEEDTSLLKNNGYFVKTYYRDETTLYYGNHVVQAVIYTMSGGKIHSNYLIVKVR